MRFLLLLLLPFALLLPAQAAAKTNTVVIHPSEVIYARFEFAGKKIRLVHAGKEKDDQAQVIFTATRNPDTLEVTLRVENKFPQDLAYQVVVHSIKLDRDATMPETSVVGGKLGFESYAPLAEELIISGFRLER
jgi:hypothetical protein